MRIICPNCSAQYEVEAAAIPPEGRYVQCSACGHGWLQPSMAPAPAAGPEPGGADIDAPAADGAAVDGAAVDGAAADGAAADGAAAGGAAGPAAEAAPALSGEAAPGAGPGGGGAARAGQPVADRPDPDERRDADGAGLADQETAEEDLAETEASAAPRRGLDAAVRAVLEAEAAREAEARRAEAAQALAAAAAPGRVTPRRSWPAGEEAEPSDPAAASGAGTPLAARKRLPAIEEVDSALGPGAEADLIAPPPADAEAGRRGFRTGFFGVLGLAVLALAVYLYARGMDSPPPALAAYAGAMDRAHLALTEGLDGLMRWLTDLISSNAA